jgi:glutamine amidotransferase
VRKYPLVRRELMLAIKPELFPSIEGSTDSEVLFFLALTFGLELAPVTALERMVAFVEATGRKNGIEQPLNMTVCATDGEQIVAVRYSSERDSRTLFHSSSFHQLHELYPHDPRITAAGDDAFLVLSEPLVDLPGWWKEIPESTAVVARGGEIEQYPFNPHRG